jgi:hypothetical protein
MRRLIHRIIGSSVHRFIEKAEFGLKSLWSRIAAMSSVGVLRRALGPPTPSSAAQDDRVLIMFEKSRFLPFGKLRVGMTTIYFEG